MSYVIERGRGFKCRAVLWTKPLKRLYCRVAVITGLKSGVNETNSIALCHVERSLPQLRDC